MVEPSVSAEPATAEVLSPASALAVVLVAALGLLLGLLVDRWLLALVLAAPALGWVLLLRHRRRAEQNRVRWEQELAAEQERRVAEAAAALAAEHEELRRTATGPEQLMGLVTAGSVWDGSAWGGSNELLVRLGIGDLPSRTTPGAVLSEVPVVVSLQGTGVLGLAGVGARALARWVVAQAAAHRSPADLSIWLLADPARTGMDAEWGWLRSLPHNRGQRSARLIGATDQALAERVAELAAIVARRTAVPAPVQPDLLVVLDGANALRSLPGIRQLLATGPGVGVHLVCVAELVGALPPECRATAALTPGALELRVGDAAALTVLPDSLDAAAADRLAAALPDAPAPMPDPLPVQARLLEVLSLDGLTAEAVADRWERGAQPWIARGDDGPVELALEPGPVLVAGDDADATGGLLRSVVCSLALTFPPAAVSLVLMTTGEQLSALAGLPHVVGALADPEPAEAARVLASLSAELDRRAKVLAAVAATDIDAYLAAGHRELPRLVVVVDEVTAVLPELRTGLLALAGRGKPVGLHLVLGAAEVAGLSGELLQQAGQRFVLHLASPTDARRVLGSAAAAELLPGAVGRGYVRVGDGPLVPFQAGSVDVGPSQLSPTGTSWEALGEPLTQVAGQGSDLTRVVSALAEVDTRRAASPWLPPLPDRVALTDLGAEGRLGAVPFGLEDRPGEQAQRPACWDVEHGGNLLVVGTRESGRSTLLRTLGVSLAQQATASDLHLYALDCGDGALSSLAGLPNCGAVVSATEPERAERLLARLSAEVTRRQRQLADRGFADLAAQRAGTADPLPYLVLLIDSWERFVEAHGWVDDGPLHDTLADVLRDGAATGVRVVMAADASVLGSDLAVLLKDRLALRLDERGDYVLAGVAPSAVPEQVKAGRGFRTVGGAVNAVQVALLPGESGARGQALAVEQIAAELPPARGRKPFRVDVLPRQVSVREAADLPTSGPGAPFAVGGDELRLQTVNLAACGPGFTIAGRPGSGRSTALAVLATGLLETGTELVVVTPAASRLRDLAGEEGVLLVTDGPDRRIAAHLERTKGRVAVVIDDAERLDDAGLDATLRDLLVGGRASDHSVVLAGDVDWLASAHAGFAFEAQRSRSGLILCPDSPERGELFGVRLPRSAVFDGPPGRAVLVRSGQLQVVQVPAP